MNSNQHPQEILDCVEPVWGSEQLFAVMPTAGAGADARPLAAELCSCTVTRESLRPAPRGYQESIEPRWGGPALLQLLPGEGCKSFAVGLEIDPKTTSNIY